MDNIQNSTVLKLLHTSSELLVDGKHFIIFTMM